MLAKRYQRERNSSRKRSLKRLKSTRTKKWARMARFPKSEEGHIKRKRDLELIIALIWVKMPKSFLMSISLKLEIWQRLKQEKSLQKCGWKCEDSEFSGRRKKWWQKISMSGKYLFLKSSWHQMPVFGSSLLKQKKERKFLSKNLYIRSNLLLHLKKS